MLRFGTLDSLLAGLGRNRVHLACCSFQLAHKPVCQSTQQVLTAHCSNIHNIYTVRQRRFRAHTRYLTYVHILNTDAESLDTRRSKTKAFACKKEKKTPPETRHTVGPNKRKYRQKLNQEKSVKLTGSYLCLQQFTHFVYKCVAQYRKRKCWKLMLWENSWNYSIKKKRKWIYFWQVLAIWNYCAAGRCYIVACLR